MKYLIIGKNSRIICEIRSKLENFQFLSHTEMTEQNLKEYEKIFVFSWSHKSFNENSKLLNQLDLTKVCLISTVAVLSLTLRRQWANYPRHKAMAEKLVLDAGGQVLRIGIWNEHQAKKLGGIIPLTNADILLSAIKASLDTNQRIINAFELVNFPSHNSLADKYLGILSDFLISSKYLQFPIAAISKLIGLNRYGYTRDCLKFFQNEVIVGHGVVGTALAKEAKRKKIKIQTVVSHKPNEIWNDDGFVNTMIGYDGVGLSNYWHGVHIEEKPNGVLEKKVPFVVKRPKVPFDAIKMHINSIEFNSDSIFLEGIHHSLSGVGIWAKRVHLAAGVYQNTALMSDHIKTDTFSLSDQELINLGTVSRLELMRKGYLNKKWFFISGRTVVERKIDGRCILLDFRPSFPMDFEGKPIDLLYYSRSLTIVMKLLQRASVRAINQAVFNKVGIALDLSGHFDVYAQIECNDCITIEQNSKIFRERLTPQAIAQIQAKIGEEFTSFLMKTKPKSSDAIHLFGKLPKLKLKANEEMKSGRLKIYGFAEEGQQIGARHHTRNLVQASLEKFIYDKH